MPRLECPICRYDLDGHPDVPREPGMRFSARVRCPECGWQIPEGAHILVGSQTSKPFARTAAGSDRLIDRLRASKRVTFAMYPVLALLGNLVVFGLRHLSGKPMPPLAWVLALFAAILLVSAILGYVQVFVLPQRSTRNQGGGGVPFAPRRIEATKWGVRWWSEVGIPTAEERSREEARASVDPSQSWGPDATSACGRGYGMVHASAVRSVRIVELWPSGDGVLAQAIVLLDPIAAKAGGLPSQSDALYLVLPRGAAARIAAGMLATIRGRNEGEDLDMFASHGAGDGTICVRGSSARPRRGRDGAREPKPGWGCSAMVVALMATVALTRFAGGWGCFIGWIAALAVWVLFVQPNLGLKRKVDAVEWAVSPGSIRIGRGRSIGADRISHIEVEFDRGVPLLRLVCKGRWANRPRLVPDDWFGVDPAAAGRLLADKLGVRCIDRTVS